MKVEFSMYGNDLTVGQLVDVLKLYPQDSLVRMVDDAVGAVTIEMVRNYKDEDTGAIGVLIGCVGGCAGISDSVT